MADYEVSGRAAIVTGGARHAYFEERGDVAFPAVREFLDAEPAPSA